jgi:hypothetical protein
VPAGKLEEKNMKFFFFASLKSLKKESDPDLDKAKARIRGSVSALKCHGSPTLLFAVLSPSL